MKNVLALAAMALLVAACSSAGANDSRDVSPPQDFRSHRCILTEGRKQDDTLFGSPDFRNLMHHRGLRRVVRCRRCIQALPSERLETQSGVGQHAAPSR